MDKQSRSLSWVTPAKYVGPMMLLFSLGGLIIAIVFSLDKRFSEAIVTLLIAICFLLVGLADLLGEMIMKLEK